MNAKDCVQGLASWKILAFFPPVICYIILKIVDIWFLGYILNPLSFWVFTLFSIIFCFFRLQGTLERLASKLESVYNTSGGKKINLISHSMGGLLVKCFMSLHSDVPILFLSLVLTFTSEIVSHILYFCVFIILNNATVLQIFEKYVKNWIAIAAPFRGK